MSCVKIEQVKSWCREVGEYQRQKFREEIKVTSKEQKMNLVSEVDEKSEAMLRKNISSNFPDHEILAEEMGGGGKNSSHLWVIDPLDGTVNYVHGLPIFAISIALFVENEPQIAVVYLPREDVFYTARRGQGSYRNDRKIKINSEAKLDSSIVATGFPYDHQQESEEVLSYFSRVLPVAGGIRRTGSAVYDLCQVAAGVFGGFWEIKLKPWDIAAGTLIVKEAGGIVTDFSGEEIKFFGEEIAAGPPGLHAELIEKLQGRMDK